MRSAALTSRHPHPIRRAVAVVVEARLTRLVVEVAPEAGVALEAEEARRRHSWPLPEEVAMVAEVAGVRPCRRRSWLPPEEVAVVGHRTRLAVAAVVGA